MINFNLRISNPFNSKWETIVSKHGKFNDKVGWETSLSKTRILFSLGFETRIGCDHQGLHLNLGFLGYETDLEIYEFAHKH